MTEADRISTFARVPHEVAELVVIAATRGGHSLRALRGSSNRQDLVEARRWVIARARPKFSYPVIGRALNRDHTSILYHDHRLREEAA